MLVSEIKFVVFKLQNLMAVEHSIQKDTFYKDI
jgi:hypothetical protein